MNFGRDQNVYKYGHQIGRILHLQRFKMEYDVTSLVAMQIVASRSRVILSVNTPFKTACDVTVARTVWAASGPLALEYG